MYVYKDTNAQIVFKHPHPGPLYVSVFRGSTQLYPPLGVPSFPLTPDDTVQTSFGGIKVYRGAINYVITQYPGSLRVEWRDADTREASTFVKDQFIDVITPIAPLDYIESAVSESGAGDSNPNVFAQQVKDMENTVRLIIEAYTGRKFTSYTGTKYVQGVQGLSKLLDEATTIDSISPPPTADLMRSFTYLNIKQAPPEEFVGQAFDGVIRVPNDYYKNVRYTVTGTWGYADIPAAVQEAAMILIKELSCNETLYRDRYLQVVSYADNRFQFNSQAFSGTGNAKADQLLDPYKRGGMIMV
jgi:hypothetical protein